MGLQWVLWMMVLTFSTSWKVQVKTTGSSLTNWTHHHDFPPFTQEMIKPNLPTAPFVMHDEQQRTPLTSTDEYFSMIYTSENQLEDSASANTGVVNAIRRENGEQGNSLKILELQNTRKVSKLSVEEASLSRMLVTVAKAELMECDLVLAYGAEYSGISHAVLQDLLLLQNPRQVAYVNTTGDLTRIIWTSSMCRGYFFLLDDPELLFAYARIYEETWDYNGRYILVGPSLLHLEAFIESSVGKRTEHIVGAVKSGTEGEWMLYMNQLYWGPGVRRINTWYRHRFTRQLDLFPDKLADFQGAVLKVSLFNYEPCNFLRRAENGTVVHRYGMDVEVLTAVARILNMTLEFTETPNEENWGERLENGSWYGLTGQLDRHEVDIGLACFFVSSHWAQVVGLTASYITESMSFMIRVEPPLPHWQALAFPFHQWTWLAVVIGFIVSGPLLFLLARGSGRCGGEIKSLQSLSYAWYYAFGVHFCEAHISLPRNPCTQIFVQFLWLYTLILTSVYSATLKSFLSVKKQPAVMETFQDLYESGLEIGAVSDLFKYELAASTNPYLQGLARSFKFYDSVEKVFPPLLQGQTVWLVSRLTADYFLNSRFTRRGVSRVRIMKEYYMTYNVGLGLQRHSPLIRTFDIYMIRMQQSGLVGKFILDSLRLDASIAKNDRGGDDIYSGQDDEEVRADGVAPLTIDHMQSLFLITCIGWLCSVLSFIMEKTVLSD